MRGNLEDAVRGVTRCEVGGVSVSEDTRSEKEADNIDNTRKTKDNNIAANRRKQSKRTGGGAS